MNTKLHFCDESRGGKTLTLLNLNPIPATGQDAREFIEQIRTVEVAVEFKATVRDERNEEAAFQAQKRTFKLSSDVFDAIFRHEILKFCWSDPAIND